MRKKMNILCIVILVFTVAMTLSQFIELFFSADNSSSMMSVYVVPTHIGDDNMVTLTDSNTGSEVKAWVKEAVIENTFLEHNKEKAMQLFFILPVTIIGLVAWFMFIVYLIRFVIAINKGRVFTWKTTRLLRMAGWSSLVSSVLMMVIIVYIVHVSSDLFEPQGYKYNYSYAIVQLPSMLPGLLLLLMVQIFGIGVQQKEELEQVV
ncbi:MAG: DUF2975 domain-containing protein [Prevotella sp.]|uniref:DUF2975 domain-containing protein n=1 Tax=Prevotella sp. TaxID=59823 RepID=UPI002A8340EF|nr:DUF2975 domain-containing protein [Prevotella sp.]MDY4019887.1 DUF2975 domain-containing protein [Prevotella sp.]